MAVMSQLRGPVITLVTASALGPWTAAGAQAERYRTRPGDCRGVPGAAPPAEYPRQSLGEGPDCARTPPRVDVHAVSGRGNLEVASIPNAPLSGQAAQEAREYAPGMTRREFVDPSRRSWSGGRARPVTTLVWYPAENAMPAETLGIGPRDAPLFRAGVVAGNAAIAGGGRRPLVLLSHGTGGSALQMAWLGIGLAKAGFIAAAVNHHGNTGAEPPLDPRGFFLWWERAADLRVALDRLLADPILGPRIDSTRIAAAGFSLGGYTVLSVAGARTDLDAYRAFCASSERDFTCGPQPEFPEAPALFARVAASDSAVRASLRRAGDSHADPRVRAVIALAPAVVRALTPASLAAVRAPLLIVVGDSDRIAPPATNARYVVAAVRGSRLVSIPRADHYVFLNVCTERGRQLIPATCADAAGVDRAAVHALVVATATRFLRNVLGAPR